MKFKAIVVIDQWMRELQYGHNTKVIVHDQSSSLNLSLCIVKILVIQEKLNHQ